MNFLLGQEPDITQVEDPNAHSVEADVQDTSEIEQGNYAEEQRDSGRERSGAAKRYDHVREEF